MQNDTQEETEIECSTAISKTVLKAEYNHGFLLAYIIMCSFAIWAQTVTSEPVPKMFGNYSDNTTGTTITTDSLSLFLNSFKGANTSPTKYDLVTLSAPVNVPRVKNQDYRKRKETVNHYVWPKNDIIACPIGETYIDATYRCRSQKRLHEPCRFSKQCSSFVPNSVCEYPSDKDDIKRCICPHNYITNSRISRDYCFATNICSLPNSAQVFNPCSENEICLDGICQCLEGYYWNSNYVCTPESFYKLEEVKSTTTSDAKSAIITSVPTSTTPANVDHSTHSEGSTISTRVADKTAENPLLVEGLLDRNPTKLMNCTKELEKVKKERVVEENSGCILSRNQLFILIFIIFSVAALVLAFIIYNRNRENNERPNQENIETEMTLIEQNA